MLDLVTEATTLGVLLEETRGVVGVVLGTTEGEVRGTVGSVRDSDAGASVAATLGVEFNKIGMLLGLGGLGVVSIKSPTAARVVAQQSGAVLVIELDPKRPVGELETKLRTLAWAPPDERLEVPPPSRPSAVGLVRPPTPLPLPPPHPVIPPPPPAIPPPPAVVSPPPAVAPLPAIVPPPSPHVIATATPHVVPHAMPPLAPPLSASTLAAPRTTTPPPLSAVPSLRHTPPPPPAPVKPPPPPPAPAGNGATASKTVGGGPAFAGDLEEFSLPDLLEFLRNSHRTGLLVCSTSTGTGTVQLTRGLIIAADSPNALDLREYLLTNAEIPPEQRQVLAALPPEYFGDDMIEGVLVSRDLVPRDEVERARIARIYSAFREMVGWTSGRFAFDPTVPIVSNPALALSAQSILMQIYQEQDEEER